MKHKKNSYLVTVISIENNEIEGIFCVYTCTTTDMGGEGKVDCLKWMNSIQQNVIYQLSFMP